MISVESSSRFNSLDEKTRQVMVALLDTRSSLSTDIQDQTLAIAQMLSRAEIAALDQHDKTRAIIINTIRQASGVAQNNTLQTAKWEDEVVESFNKEEASLKLKVERTILESLKFSTMTDRINEVPEAFAQTCRWIFNEPLPQTRPWSSFVDWLQDGSGVYWINGKAASGKSTLMRYIHYHVKTTELLQSWANPLHLSRASFFFWNSGTLEQRSQVGFLRALLYEVLQRQQELIPLVLSPQWARTYSELLDPAEKRDLASWTPRELIQGLRLLANKEIINIRLFLLIDGLDEFEGDYGEIAELICSLAKSSNLKICVSSRPLLVFDDSFHDCPSLRLHELTQHDIKHFVTNKLGGHPRFQVLAAKEPERAPALIEDIVAKANGVFLWVKLTVHSLISGLSNRDGITDLQRRLLLIPPDLEDLYALMLKRIDPFYITKASEMFQLVRAQRDPERRLTAVNLMSQQPFTIFALAMADHEQPHNILCSTAKSWSADEILAACSEMEDRLKVRCAGLLEVQRLEEFGRSEVIKPLSWRSKVQYIHRTARDYMEKPEVWDAMVKHTRGAEFYPFKSLFLSGVLQLRLFSARPIQTTFGSIRIIALMTMFYASLVESHTSLFEIEWITKLHEAMCHYQKSSPESNHQNWVQEMLISPSTDHDSFLSLTIQFDLGTYVQHALANDGKLIRNKKGRPLLDYAVSPRQWSEASASLVETLLKHGADPNEKFEGHSPWENAILRQVHLNATQTATNPERQKNRATFLRLMLEYGADRKFCGTGALGPFSVLSVARMFMSVAPSEAKKMETLLRSKGTGRKYSMKKGLLGRIVNSI